jgi:hypothetical protein
MGHVFQVVQDRKLAAVVSEGFPRLRIVYADEEKGSVANATGEGI